jgi:hypothetical protein
MEVSLSGYANDYVCKGMAGGSVTVAPPAADLAQPQRQVGFSMVGNTVLYGATGGSLWVAGRGGERFAVRNSGALGVVEGLGDHGAEYMTAGTILCLGNVGRCVFTPRLLLLCLALCPLLSSPWSHPLPLSFSLSHPLPLPLSFSPSVLLSLSLFPGTSAPE